MRDEFAEYEWPPEFDIKIEERSVKHDILPLYLEGKTIPEIAKACGIKDYQSLRNAINEYVDIVKNKLKTRRAESINPEDIYNLRIQGKSVAKISSLYNLPTGRVDKIFKQYCIDHNIDRKIFSRAKLENVDSEELVKRINDGMTIEQLANEYDVSVTAIRYRVLQVISLAQLKEIYSKNRTRKYVSEEKAHEIMELYQQGISKEEIALRFGCSKGVIQKVLSSEYGKMGATEIPKIINKNSFITRINMNKDATREELLKDAEKSNVIIPQVFLDEHFGPEDIDINKIRKYVINQFSNVDLDEEERKALFRGFNVAKDLKEKEYEVKYQAIALTYLLPQIVGISMQELYKILNDDKEVIDALNAILSDDSNQKEYIERVRRVRYAQEVKLAIVLEEIREHTLRKEKIDYSKYVEYIKLANHTKFKVEMDIALFENENCLKGEDR